VRSLLALLLALVAGYGVFSSVNALQSLGPRHGRFEELLYFPSGVFVREATAGYRNLAADAIWLEFIQYYGEHRLTDQKFLYLGHILDVLTDLDPRFLSAYTYGALLLVTDAHENSKGIALLRKGMKNNPQSWQIPFTAGFLDYIFIRNYDEAGRYFAQAATLPGAPPACDRFAGYVAQKMNQEDVAQSLLEHVLGASHNRDEQDVLRYYIMKLQMKQLNKATKLYQDRTGKAPDRHLQELIRSGLLASIPEEPHGGLYYFNPDSGRVVSTWKFRP
jgi:tetratricopeptide (TPR) repeat protein